MFRTRLVSEEGTFTWSQCSGTVLYWDPKQIWNISQQWGWLATINWRRYAVRVQMLFSEKGERSSHWISAQTYRRMDETRQIKEPIDVADSSGKDKHCDSHRRQAWKAVKVYLTPFFFSLKRICLFLEILLWNNFWMPLNPRFSVPRRNLENSFKTPPFCFATEFEENGSSGSCDVYPWRLHFSRPVISFRMAHYAFESTWKRFPEVLQAVAAISQI